MTQMTLPIAEVKSRCGYCNRRLVAVLRHMDQFGGPVTLYECPRCAPLLRALSIDGFPAFVKVAHKDRVKS